MHFLLNKFVSQQMCCLWTRRVASAQGWESGTSVASVVPFCFSKLLEHDTKSTKKKERVDGRRTCKSSLLSSLYSDLRSLFCLPQWSRCCPITHTHLLRGFFCFHLYHLWHKEQFLPFYIFSCFTDNFKHQCFTLSKTIFRHIVCGKYFPDKYWQEQATNNKDR